MENSQRQIALVVDDDVDNLTMISKALEFQGLEVHRARSADEALEKLQAIKPDFMLFDLNMPRTDGWELLNTVRAMPQVADIPVIAITAYAMLGDRDEILGYGFDGYIPKPFLPRHLLDTIHAWIKDRKPAISA